MHRTEGANNVAGLYSAGPPPTTITADALNSIQEEICNVIEYSGQAIQTAATDTRNQLLTALLALIPTYDAVVVSQASWDAIIERTAANTYQFKDDYKSVFVKVGDYALTLSGGDTWGQLQTNNVTHLEFECAATITFGNTPGYLNVNTPRCYLKNVTVKGLGTVASAVQYSFLLSAAAVTFDNCVALRRLSNTNMTGFQGSATASHNLSTKYINCRSVELTSSGNISGFYLCQNMVECTVNACACTGSGVLYGFSTCDNISSSQVYSLDSANGNCAGFYTCNQVSACKVFDIDTSGTGVAYGYHTCMRVSACIATDIQSAVNVDSYGFHTCAQTSGCTVSVIDATGTGDVYGFLLCVNVSACYAYDLDGADNVYGFHSCSQISACYAYDIETTGAGGVDNAVGFISCNQVSGCTATKIDSNAGLSYGFQFCNRISACYATDIDASSGTANGFSTCTYGAALNTNEAANAGNDFMDTTDAAITNKFSTMATGWT